MPNATVHIYMTEEEERTIKNAAAELQTSVAALMRGSIKYLTNDLTDFSKAREWLDFRARGRPQSPSTGNPVNDAARDIYRHTVPQGELEDFQADIARLTGEGMSLDDAIAAVMAAKEA